MNRWRVSIPVTLALLISAMSAQVALGHGIELGATSQQGVEVTAVYEGGEPMAGAQVSVFAPDEPAEPWLRGTADDEGRFFFVPDAQRPGVWDVQVRQAGHGGIIRIEVEPGGETQGAFEVEAMEGGLTGLQRALVVASVVWGAIGTALYFKGRSG